MVDPIEAEKGHYYLKQIECKSSIIAWSHMSRFQVGLRLIGSSPRNLLDYGCGDGTFLTMAADRIQQGCGADIAANQIQDCQQRLAQFSNISFLTIGEIDGETHDFNYDVVTCMETLEHCTNPIVEIVLRDLARLVSPGGRVIISVPIETGATFLIKLAVRKLAAMRGLSDYKYYESYTLPNALQMLFASHNTTIARPVYGEPDAPYHSHYGFNWLALREQVRSHFTIEQTLFSPIGLLGGGVSSQAWFVCQPHE